MFSSTLFSKVILPNLTSLNTISMLTYISSSAPNPDFPNAHSASAFVFLIDFSNLVHPSPHVSSKVTSPTVFTVSVERFHHTAKLWDQPLLLSFSRKSFSVHYQIMSALLKNVPTMQSLLKTCITGIVVSAIIFVSPW